MNNKKVREIIKFSICKNIQNKWFIILNLLLLVGTIVGLNFSNISKLLKLGEEKTLSIEMVDNSNLVYDSFFADLSGDEKYSIAKIDSNDYTAETIPEETMVIEINEDEIEGFKIKIVSQDAISTKLYNPIGEELFKIRNGILESKYGVEKEKIEIFQKELNIERIMLSVKTEDSDLKEIINFVFATISYIVAVILFSKMASEIASEKQSKATEYILTTVSAKEYLFAKVFSNIAVILIQGLFILSYYFIAMLISNMINPIQTSVSLNDISYLNNINKDVVFSVVILIVFNVLNLILMSIIQATLASKTSSTSEAGNSTTFLSMIMMIGYFVTIYALTPYSKASLIFYIISCIPILSTYLIPGMIAINQANVVQIIVSLLVLIVSIPIAFNYCSRMFKDGILDYTKTRKSNKKIRTEEEETENLFVKRDMKKFGFVIGLSIIIYVGMQVFVSIICGAIISALFKNILTSSEISLMLQILAQVFSLGLAMVCINSFNENNKKEEVKKPIDIKDKAKIILIALVIIFALQIILSYVLYPSLGLDYDTTNLYKVSDSSRLFSKVLLILAIAVIPAIFEELMFRKTIISFSSKYGKVFAFLFSALFFGLLHMNLSQALFAFIMGLIFGAIYIYTGDIKISMIIHFINNGVAAVLLILPPFGIVVFIALLLIVLIIGFIISINEIAKKENREKIISYCNIQVNLKQIQNKYKYVFYEYSFDVSIVLLFLLGMVTEKLLR